MNYKPFVRIPLITPRHLHISAIKKTNKPSPLIDSLIRVDHAGELGANCIYAGQLAILGNSKVGPLIQHMMDQEKVHKETFDKLLVKYRVRPTILTPVWNVAGYLLGAGTALLGEKAAMACTVAVESVIVEHYNEQLRLLMVDPEENKELMDTIKKFRDEEQEHHDHGVDHGAEQAPFYNILSEVIKFGCKQAISISKGFLAYPKKNHFFMARKYSTSANIQPNTKWDLYGAVCLERKPLILKPLNKLEAKVKNVLLELEGENSYKSDHEVKGERDLKRAELLKSGASAKDLDVETFLEQTAHEFEELADKEFQNFEAASTITNADKNNDVRSLNRKLSSHLLFLIKDKIGNQNHWILPFGLRKNTENLRETAERILNETCGDKLKVLFLGNAPCGFYKYKYPKKVSNGSCGAKIFFFKALYISGSVEMNKDKNFDYLWATRSEVNSLLENKRYLKKVSMFLIEDTDDHENNSK